MNEITYRHILLKDLVPWAEEIVSKAGEGDFVPITLHRAEAMATNPYGAPEDVSMIAAYLGDKCVGYFGVMPIMVKLGDVVEKLSWFTTWTVAPETQGMGVGSGLLKSALTIEEDFMIVGSHFAVRTCEKQGFARFEDFEYSMIDVRLVGKYNPVSAGMRLLRKVSTLMGKEWQVEKKIQKVNQFFAKLYVPMVREGMYAKTLEELDVAVTLEMKGIEIRRVPKVAKIELELLPAYAFLRDEKVINWMLEYPWVAKTGESATEKMNYYFTDARDEFEMQAYEFYEGAKRVAVLTLMVTKIGKDRRQVRVLDCLAEDALLPLIRKFVVEVAQEYGAVQMMGDVRVLGALAETAMGKVYEVKERTYQTMTKKDSVFAKDWEKITKRFADGDMAFT